VKPFVGLANYRELLHDPLFLERASEHRVYSLYVPATMIAALAAALVLNQRLPRQSALLRTIVLSAVRCVVCRDRDRLAVDIQRRLRAAQRGAARRHLPAIDWLGNPATALPSVMLVSAWVWLGYQMVIYLAGLQGIPQSLYEAANARRRERVAALPAHHAAAASTRLRVLIRHRRHLVVSLLYARLRHDRGRAGALHRRHGLPQSTRARSSFAAWVRVGS
jgi:ABC-type polysaccharide transport system permease subunit